VVPRGFFLAPILLKSAKFGRFFIVKFKAEESRTQYVENLFLRRLFTFSPLSGVSPTAVLKAKIHPQFLRFRCFAV